MRCAQLRAGATNGGRAPAARRCRAGGSAAACPRCGPGAPPAAAAAAAPPPPATPFDGLTFSPIREAELLRRPGLVRRVGRGGAAAYELSKVPGLKVALVEQSVAPGGGAWLGGQLFSAMVRKPADALLRELGVGFEEAGGGGRFVVVPHAASATSALIAAALAGPANVKLFNATAVEDLVVKGGRVAGVVTNWAAVTLYGHGTQSCMDPNVLEAKVVVSACGHDGPLGATVVKRLAVLGLAAPAKGMAALDMSAAENAVVAATREVCPGLILAGMEVAEQDGCPRMGPTFGAMLLSGQKAAYLALRSLGMTAEAEALAEGALRLQGQGGGGGGEGSEGEGGAAPAARPAGAPVAAGA